MCNGQTGLETLKRLYIRTYVRTYIQYVNIRDPTGQILYIQTYVYTYVVHLDLALLES